MLFNLKNTANEGMGRKNGIGSQPLAIKGDLPRVDYHYIHQEEKRKR